VRPIAACTHRVQHVHGDRNGYRCGCRCDPCARAKRGYDKARQRSMGGRITTLPVEPVRAHILDLIAAGMTRNQITRAVGMSLHSIEYILTRDVRVYPETSARIMRLGLGVTPVGVRRRLQALSVIGWTQRELGARLGVSGSCLSQTTATERTFIKPASATAIVRLYNELWAGCPTPNRRVIRDARRKGWAPPLAWDDDTIDDARVKPRGLHPIPITIDELIEDLMDMADAGRSWPEAAARCGYAETTSLARRLERHGRLVDVRAAYGVSLWRAA